MVTPFIGALDGSGLLSHGALLLSGLLVQFGALAGLWVAKYTWHASASCTFQSPEGSLSAGWAAVTSGTTVKDRVHKIISQKHPTRSCPKRRAFLILISPSAHALMRS